MNGWRVLAHGAYEARAEAPAASLAATLRACMDKPPRRINRYIRLALIGAQRCLARLEQPLAPTTPLFMASEQGNVAETVALMDDIVVHGRSPMPMPFINVSSNMVGYYLAASLGLSGRNMNVARDQGAFGALLELATLEADIAPPPQGRMLLGSVIECVWPLAEHRQRCQLPPDTPLVEASYWLVVDQGNGSAADNQTPCLWYAQTENDNEARDWLAAGECWALDPHLPEDRRQALRQGLHTDHEWRAPLCHRGHADAVMHALFAALHTQPRPRLHVVMGDTIGGHQLMAIE